MTLHQPAMAHHHMPRWLEFVGVAMIVLAVVIGLALVVGTSGVLNRQVPVAPDRIVISGAHGGAVEYTGVPWRTGVAPGIAVQSAHGGILYEGIPYPTGIARGISVQTENGGILYAGIPYPTGIMRGISVQTEHGGILYVGIPYPAPASETGG